MKLEKIITLASTPVRLRLLAMVRSLRAVGCDLPVWVIPYGDAPESRFPLPDGCEWWELPEVTTWASGVGAHAMTRKYQSFLTGNYQFVDTDVVFLRNPEEVLAPWEGFVASCGHWREPAHTLTAEFEKILRHRSTNWQREVFNAGQFACDRPLFEDFESIRRLVHAPEYTKTCLEPVSEQPGINLLRLLSGVPVYNVTLPPANMESTWAGDYPDAEYGRYWLDEERRPYLIHWAGTNMADGRPIHELFYRHLATDELEDWHAEVRLKGQHKSKGLRPRLRRAKHTAQRVWDAVVDG